MKKFLPSVAVIAAILAGPACAFDDADRAAVNAIAVEQMKTAMPQVQINAVSYDLEGMTTATTAAARDYAIVSTATAMEMGGAAVKAQGPALAFEDDGKWYVLRIQSPDQAALLAQVYPDLAAIDLPAPPSLRSNNLSDPCPWCYVWG